MFPVIGQTPVVELKAHTLITALEPVRVRGALETLRRLTQRINEIMTFAVNSGLLDANPASTTGFAVRRYQAIRGRVLPAGTGVYGPQRP